MKKQEFIHVHGLLAQVATFYEQQTGENVDTTKYEAVGVRPTSIHQSKTDHKEAVSVLSKCLSMEMTDGVMTSTIVPSE